MVQRNKKSKLKRKKIKYFSFEIKLSKPEKEKIDFFCKVRKTTANKLIKSALREYMIKYKDLKIPEPVSKNQMNIFDVIENIS